VIKEQQSENTTSTDYQPRDRID